MIKATEGTEEPENTEWAVETMEANVQGL